MKSYEEVKAMEQRFVDIADQIKTLSQEIGEVTIFMDLFDHGKGYSYCNISVLGNNDEHYRCTYLISNDRTPGHEKTWADYSKKEEQDG